MFEIQHFIAMVMLALAFLVLGNDLTLFWRSQGTLKGEVVKTLKGERRGIAVGPMRRSSCAQHLKAPLVF